jgi:hypothetical protein
MTPELAGQIRELIDQGAPPVSLAEIAVRAHAPVPRPAPARSRLRLAWAAVAAGAVAVGSMAAIIAAQLTAPPHPAVQPGAVLTAAQLRQVTAASWAALGYSAQAYITYGGPGPYHAFQSEYVAFSGENYSFSGSVINPSPGGRPGQVSWFSERVVNGQAYDYLLSDAGWSWFHYARTPGGRTVRILDPRAMLGVLAPGARFRFAGRVVVGGVPLERLQASDPAAVPGLFSLPDVQPGEYVTALYVLVDTRGVVHRVEVSLRGPTLDAAAHPQSAAGKAAAGRSSAMSAGSTVTVTFADIGRPQSITAPAHAINIGTPCRPLTHAWNPPPGLAGS